MYDLCISNKCSECDGIDVEWINNELFRCNRESHLLYKFDDDSLIEVSLLNDTKWLNMVKHKK